MGKRDRPENQLAVRLLKFMVILYLLLGVFAALEALAFWYAASRALGYAKEIHQGVFGAPWQGSLVRVEIDERTGPKLSGWMWTMQHTEKGYAMSVALEGEGPNLSIRSRDILDVFTYPVSILLGGFFAAYFFLARSIFGKRRAWSRPSSRKKNDKRLSSLLSTEPYIGYVPVWLPDKSIPQEVQTEDEVPIDSDRQELSGPVWFFVINGVGDLIGCTSTTKGAVTLGEIFDYLDVNAVD